MVVVKHKIILIVGMLTSTIQHTHHIQQNQKKVVSFDLVVCIDVLEHIPQADLPRIIKEIFDYSGKYVFATAAVNKAGKTLPNGMNAHATVQPEEWWNKLFEPYKGRFTLDFTTKKPKRQSSDIYNIEEKK